MVFWGQVASSGLAMPPTARSAGLQHRFLQLPTLISRNSPAAPASSWAPSHGTPGRATPLPVCSSSSSSSSSYLDAPGLAPPPPPNRGWVTKVQRAVTDAVPALASPELMRRLGATLVLLLLARAGHFLLIPGLDQKLAAQSVIGASMVGELTGMRELPGNIFELSITPLLSAYLFIGIVGAIPEFRRDLEALREAGRQGRETLAFYTNALFLFFAAFDAFGRSKVLAAFAAAQPVGWLWRLGVMVNMMAGAAVVKHIMQMLDVGGLGDGAGTLIALGVAVNYADFLGHLLPALFQTGMLQLPVILVAVLCLLLAGAMVAVQGLELRLPLVSYTTRRTQVFRSNPVLLTLRQQDPRRQRQQQRQQRQRQGPAASPALPSQQPPGAPAQPPAGAAGPAAGQAQWGSSFLSPEWQDDVARQAEQELQAKSYFPLRLAPSGARQLLFANWVASALDTPLSWIGWQGLFKNHPLGFALLVFIMETWSLADTTPRQVAEFLANSHTCISGLSPGEATEKYLAGKRGQLRLLSGVVLAGLSLLAHAVDWAAKRLIGTEISALSLLLLASMAAGISRQVDALLKGPQIERQIEREREVFGQAAG